MKHQGLVIDRMNHFPPRKTHWYETYKEAHDAAEKLCKKHYSGDRGEVDVVAEVE